MVMVEHNNVVKIITLLGCGVIWLVYAFTSFPNEDFVVINLKEL